MQIPSGPFQIPSIRDFIPEKWKPWTLIAVALVFQLSGGIYLASISEMVGHLALMREDIMMAGCASLAGMALTFSIMLRLKLRFTTKTGLSTCAIGLILANLICMHTQNVPLLIAVCFFSGILRMWATFECMSSIQLWITPKRDMSVFFCVICLLVQNSIQFSSLTTVHISFWGNWEYMHLFIIGLLCLVLVYSQTCLQHFRIMGKKLPLYGIDWIGGLMWGIMQLCIAFVLIYGEHFDWFESVYIRSATVGAFLLILANVARASHLRHPYISNQLWKYPVVWIGFGVYLLVDTLTSPAHVIEHMYMESILGYEALHLNSMNWLVVGGTIAGSIFTFLTFASRRWSYYKMMAIAFSCLTAYVLIFYFTIDYNLPKTALMLPTFLRGAGYAIVCICLLTAVTTIPFPTLFQGLSVQAFISACWGSVLGSTLVTRIFAHVFPKNLMLLGSSFDHLNPYLRTEGLDKSMTALNYQAMMVSFKEIYGYLCYIGIFCLLGILTIILIKRTRRALERV